MTLTFSIWLTLVFIHCGAVMSPGANFLVVTQNALAYSRQAGIFTVRGVASAAIIFVTAGLIGVAAVIAQFPAIFIVLRVIGALYFGYFGLRLLYTGLFIRPITVGANIGTPAMQPHDLTRWQAYRSGLFTGFSNPATLLYYLSLFTSFITSDTTPLDKLLIGVTLVTISFLWYNLVAYTFSRAQVRLLYQRFARWMNLPFGLLWLGLGIRLIAN